MAVLDFLRLRSVSHSDGAVTLRVPREWIEEVEADGTRVLWSPTGVSGSLRITLITAKRESTPTGNPATHLLGDPGDGAVDLELPNGNAYRRYRTESAEDGEALAIYWFRLANYVPPRYYRLAMFSFTVRLADENSPAIRRQLEVLERELPACRFPSAVQQWER
jgi:hypothetical protein